MTVLLDRWAQFFRQVVEKRGVATGAFLPRTSEAERLGNNIRKSRSDFLVIAFSPFREGSVAFNG